MKPQHWIATDVGVVREHNEDAFLWMSPEETDGHGYLWLIADGMGGEAAGELASRTVIEAVREVYPVAMSRGNDPYEAIEASINAANRRILRMQKRSPEMHKMGTTAVCMAYYKERVYISHVGDSRCYVWFAGELRQLTRDHTKLQMLLDAGALTEEAAKNHPAGHVLVNAIGRESMEIDHNGRTPLRIDNKVFMLCSDGLTGYVPESQIVEAMRRMYARDATESLVELARRHWSEDNASVGIVRFCEPDPDALTDRESFLKWATTQQLQRKKADPTLKVRADVLPANDETPPLASISGVLRQADSERGVDRSDSGDGDASRRGSTGRLVGRKPVRDESGQMKTVDDSELDSEQEPTISRPTQESINRPTQGLTPISKGRARPQPDGKSTRGLPTPGTGQHAPAQQTGQNPAFSSPRARYPERPAGLDRAAVEQIREYRDAEEMGETDFLNMVGKGPKQRNRLAIVLGTLLVFFIALLVVVVLKKRSDSGEQIASTIRETNATSSTRDEGGQGLLDDEEGDNSEQTNKEELPPREIVPPLGPAEASAPTSVVAPDRMSLYLVADGDRRSVYIDAHEVTVGQFRLILQNDRTLQTLHREIDSPRYAELPCSSAVSTDTADPGEPVCVSPESAQRYCSLVGRRLPTRSDWRFVFEHGGSRISGGNGLLHFFMRDGAAEPVPAMGEIAGIYGAFSGYPEILESTELDSARGDIPVLGIDSRAKQQYESGTNLQNSEPPISVQNELRTRLQTGRLEAAARPQLGFRCVADKAMFESLRSFNPVVDEQPTDVIVVPTERSTSSPSQPNGSGGSTARPSGNESTSRIERIEPFPDPETLEDRRARSRRRYPSPRSENTRDAQERRSVADDPDSHADELRTDGLLERIERRLNEN